MKWEAVLFYLKIRKNTMKISIIVPVYNAEKFINKLIESVLCQKYVNYELILVDD